jgi:hypothetical protein
VKNAVTAIAAYKKCSEFQKHIFRIATGATEDLVMHLHNSSTSELAEAGRVLGNEWVWNTMIVPSLPVSETATETATEPTA